MAGEPMNFATNRFAGRSYKFDRGADLFDAPRRKHDDAVGQRHRLDLVMGDVDHRRLGHALVQPGDLDAGRHAQCRVEIRQRLVEEEDLRVAHDCPADRDALALSARQRLGQAGKIRLELQDGRGVAHTAVDLVLAETRNAHAEGHVLIDRHVRIERVALEHHGDAALGRRDFVDEPPVDVKLAAGDFLEPGDHPQKR